MKRILLLIGLLCALPCFGASSGPFVLTATTSPCAQITTSDNYATVGIRVTGTFSATLQPGVTIQGQASTNTSVVPVGSTTSQNTITAAGTYTASVAGASTFQVCATGFVSGTATIWLNVSTGISAKAIIAAGGGVTAFSSGDFPPLFTTGVATPNSTPALTFTASSFAANTVLGNIGTASGVPSAVTAFPYAVANRTLLAQSSVDGAITTALYTVPASADGVYRISIGIVPRTLSSSAWVVNADWTPPTGTHVAALLGMGMTMNTGSISSQPVSHSWYLHAGDAITCGTVTGSGSNSGGAFDVQWTVERLN